MCHALIKHRPSVLCHPVEDHLGLTLTVELEPPWRELLRWIKLIVTVSNSTSTEHLYFFPLFLSIVTETNFILSNFFRFPNLVVSRKVGFDNGLSSVISNYFSLMSLVTNLHKFLNQQRKLLIWGSGQTNQGLQILLISVVSVTSASQILGSFWNIWSQVPQRKEPFSDFPARGPGMYTLSWGIHEVAVAVRWPVIYPLPVLSWSIIL